MRHIVADWGKERTPWMALCGTELPQKDAGEGTEDNECVVCADMQRQIVWLRAEMTRTADPPL